MEDRTKLDARWKSSLKSSTSSLEIPSSSSAIFNFYIKTEHCNIDISGYSYFSGVWWFFPSQNKRWELIYKIGMFLFFFISAPKHCIPIFRNSYIDIITVTEVGNVNILIYFEFGFFYNHWNLLYKSWPFRDCLYSVAWIVLSTVEP